MPIFTRKKNLPTPPDLSKTEDYAVFVTEEQDTEVLVPRQNTINEKPSNGLFHTKLQDVEDVKEVQQGPAIKILNKEREKSMEPLMGIRETQKPILKALLTSLFKKNAHPKVETVRTKEEQIKVHESTDSSRHTSTMVGIVLLVSMGVFIFQAGTWIHLSLKKEALVKSVENAETNEKNTEQSIHNLISTNLPTFAQSFSLKSEDIMQRASSIWMEGYKISVQANLSEQTYVLTKLQSTALNIPRSEEKSKIVEVSPECHLNPTTLKEDSNNENQTITCKHNFRRIIGYGID